MPGKFAIPISLIRLDNQSFHLVVEGMINNIPINLIIDTGASKTVFDKRVLEEKLQISDKGTYHIQSAGIMADHIESKMATAKVFKLGDLKIKNYPVILIDLEAINKLYQKVTGKTIHGLIGSDFLLDMRATIDYKKFILVLRKPK